MLYRFIRWTSSWLVAVVLAILLGALFAYGWELLGPSNRRYIAGGYLGDWGVWTGITFVALVLAASAKKTSGQGEH